MSDLIAIVRRLFQPASSTRAELRWFADGIQLTLPVSVRPASVVRPMLLAGLVALALVALFASSTLGGAAAALGALALVPGPSLRRPRHLLAHGHSRTFVVHDGVPGPRCVGGCIDDLAWSIAGGAGQHQLTLYGPGGELDMGGPVVLDDDEARTVRKFMVLVGSREVAAT